MNQRSHISFGEYHLDTRNERLWRGSSRIPLRAKSFALLQYLAERNGQLITKDELLGALWPDTHVCDDIIKHSVFEIRKALNDNAKVSRFIETAHRRGYRFIGEIAELSGHSIKHRWKAAVANLQLVGREEELQQLKRWLNEALAGQRQVVFVTGEQGIGKTALVDTFLDRTDCELSSRIPQPHCRSSNYRSRMWAARGQCFESYGAGEAYMPVLEALTGLCHGSSRSRLVAVLRRHAPLWLMQMPSLVNISKQQGFVHTMIGATRERMLREIAEALETLTSNMPLILVLEDLHWSDHSTLNLISYLARRRSPARLMLVVTFRFEEAIGAGHPLLGIREDLQIHGQCHDLPLVRLDEAAVSEYLERRFPGHEFPAGVRLWIHRQTDGNPLFMVNMVDHLVTQGLITHHNGSFTLSIPVEAMEPGVPSTIQQMITRQIERCSQEERRVLETGSVVGLEFSASAVATVLNEEVTSIEELCAGLVHRHRFLQLASPCIFSDGKQTPRFRFTHTLYKNVCYSSLPEGYRAQLHGRLAEYIEGSYSSSLESRSAQLAMHFERSGEYGRAIKYYQQAADHAIRQYAEHEALSLARRGLQLLEMMPDTAERIHQELNLRIALGSALMVTQGFGAIEVKQTFTRAHELCQQGGDFTRLFSVLLGLWKCCGIRSEFRTARELANQLLRLAQTHQDPLLLSEAHFVIGATLMHHGNLSHALEHLEKGITSRNLQKQPMPLPLYGKDLVVKCLCFAALVKWYLGFADQAVNKINEALALARETHHPESNVCANLFAAQVHQFRREGKKALELAEVALNQARQHRVEQWVACGTGIYGWALSREGRKDEGIECLRQSLARYKANGSKHLQAMVLTMLAEELGRAGNVEEGLIAVEQALKAAGGSGVTNHEGEIYRLKGDLLLQKSCLRSKRHTPGKLQLLHEAEACFERAIEISRQRQIKFFELCAAMSLARLWQKQNRQAEARQLLKEIYDWFTEGHNTSDLQKAHALLQQMQ
jgi:DNA-binding winged helix-turn-helix (wHTH) protein/tetratricopeptide (TPR) repeat protein